MWAARGALSRRVRQLVRRLAPPDGDAAGVERAFADFAPISGDRDAMLASLVVMLERLRAGVRDWRRDRRTGPALAASLLAACRSLDTSVWHADGRLRSYVDVSLPTAALRRFVDLLTPPTTGGRTTARHLLAVLLEHDPAAREALLVQAELLLEASEVDAAIASIEGALRIQAVCPTAQQLLRRAYAQRRAAGALDDGERPGLDDDLSDRFCALPFRYLSTGWQGNAHLCPCPAWQPFPVGNLLSADSAEAVWNSPAAQEVRRSILDGDFSYCSRTLCPYIAARKLPKKADLVHPVLRHLIDTQATVVSAGPTNVDLNYDASCNLACPSCRTEIRMAGAAEQATYAQARERVVLPLLRRTSGQVYLSGGGEAFASRHYRSIMSALNRRSYPGVYLYLITNGQLLTPRRWSQFPELAGMIGTLAVSIDAATAETYEHLRRPGRWAPLQANLAFIADLRRAGTLRSLWINFVVQQANYREMLDFVKLGDDLGVDRVWFQRVTNYGAYDAATFAQVDVTSPHHPEHAALLEILRHPRLQGPRIHAHMLMPLLPEVVSSSERLDFLYEPPTPGGWPASAD